jgi:drug/metabolite transporter (DMT)-like permease
MSARILSADAMIAAAPDRRLLGIGLRCTAATSFAAMNAGLKIAINHGVSVPELAFYRSFGALPLVATWILAGPGITALRTRNPIAHLTRSIIGLIALVLTFSALSWLPLAEATTLSYSAPVGATILSGLFLGETIGPRRWSAVLVGFVGMVLVMRPGATALPTIGIALGVAAALGQSVVMVTLRHMGRTENTAAIVFWFTSFTTLATALALPFYAHWHGAGVMVVLIGVGLLGGVGQLTMTASLRFAPVSVVVPFDYLQMAWAALIGWGLFGDAPASTMLGGAALIAASGIYTAYRESVNGREVNEARVMPEGN